MMFNRSILPGVIVGAFCLAAASSAFAGASHNDVRQALLDKHSCQIWSGQIKGECMQKVTEEMRQFREQVASDYRYCLESQDRRTCDAEREAEWSKIMGDDDLPR